MTVLVLHPGQMGAALAVQARRSGWRLLWCPAGRSAASACRADAAGLEPADDLHQALATARMVLAVCPPAGAEDLAAQVAAAGYRGIYVEANAISPQRLERIAARLAGSRVVDASIIGPPPSPSAEARLYLAGPPADVAEVSRLFAGTAVQTVDLGERLGDASSLKMAFAAFQKIARTLAGVSYALAEEYGLREQLRAEAARMGGSALADPDYLPSVAARGWRWAPEMQEVAETLHAAGLPSELAVAAQTVLGRWAGDKDLFDLSLEDTLAHLRQPEKENQ
ncbi:NAD(P)-dependent oxidoreductase [Sphaerimonospora thailandensis]|uniref:Phosphogluconate dehydrogenase NAD-binding putative C-terminal domain-containing protein n=1 Tax=Sphaerimonospora thailandensis TaxID=795644 RepID=A0A8J3RE18_9ACTN|nr:NAD(P)-dependent oxidoreductase [Sphaerimonospora thailandensis]GIH73030.1 hypothetical protein Mth01_52830 [Sphaerimonospora thailandensis]